METNCESRRVARPYSLRTKASRQTIALIGAMWLVSGCAHNVLYDENRDKEGQAVKKAVAEARLEDAVTSLEQTFAEVGAREEASARDRAAYLFDLELRTVSRASSLASKFDDKNLDGLQTVVQARLTKLGSVPDDQFEKIRQNGVKTKARTAALETTLSEFRGAVGFQFQSCSEIYAASAKPTEKSEQLSERFLASVASEKRSLAQIKFPALIDQCKRIDEVEAERVRLLGSGGDIKKLQDESTRIDREISEYDKEKSTAKDELNAATVTFRCVESTTKAA